MEANDLAVRPADIEGYHGFLDAQTNVDVKGCWAFNLSLVTTGQGMDVPVCVEVDFGA